ncbi:hypothetical protein B0A55_06870 [Friedmanniomyces simplex]|uniref:Uncharacterized protein n=1 Tax=Friedmanniomyces simplex TaxID=329884 RepID=A0A4U0X0P5_9PEZI|nr:hypothetical protein B0A55_06870 [Friedmanniomyces simplex]
MFPSTTTAPGGADFKPKSLLALPPELRLEIYSHVFALLVPDVEDYEVAKIDAFPGFMRACTLMHCASHQVHQHNKASMAAETVATIDSGDDDLDIHSTSIESLPPEIRVQTYDHLFASMRPPPIADDLEAPSDWLEDPVLGSFIWRDTPPPVSKTCDVFPGLTQDLLEPKDVLPDSV